MVQVSGSAVVPRPLRVGVVVDSTAVPGWVRSVLEFLDAEPAIEWANAVVATSSKPERGPVLQRAYEGLDRRRHAMRVGSALNRSDASDLLREHVVLDSGTLGTSDGWPDGAELDVLLDLRGVAPGIISRADDVEYWHLELVGEHGERIDRALVSAFAARSPICQVKLVSRSGQDSSELSSVVALDRVSLVISQTRVYERATALVVRLLQSRLRAERTDCGVPSVTFSELAGGRTPPPPGSTWVLGFAAERLAGATRVRFDKLRHAREQWIIGYRKRSPLVPFDSPDGYTPVLPPDDRMYADPFVVDHDNRTFVFLEEMSFATKKGVISVAEMLPSGDLSTPRVVLERPHHLSFPFVFREEGRWLMVPETASNGTIELYRAEHFPYRWSLERVLLDDLCARDTIVLRARGAYWLFTTIETNGTRHDELYVFRSDELTGPWLPHPCNPVVSDVRWARSAGRVFEDGGCLIRPAQDCSERYGGSLVFRRIVALDEHNFREETVARVPPRWTHGLHGTHTYNRSESVEVIDGARFVSRRRMRRGR